jgi:ribosomal protein S18 acetylase RimI-like enzyme
MDIQEQTQNWHDQTRVILFTKNASVQLELYTQPRGDYGVTAYIWALWVNPSFRRRGHATALLYRAEKIARENNRKEVYLEWAAKDTPVDILQWYNRRGYQEVEFDDDKVLLKKDLTKNKS